MEGAPWGRELYFYWLENRMHVARMHENTIAKFTTATKYATQACVPRVKLTRPKQHAACGKYTLTDELALR